jgi:DNA repair protein RadC
MKQQYETIINYNEIAEIELSYKPGIKLSKARQVAGSKDAYQIFKSLWDRDKLSFVEQFCVLLLNRANAVLGFYKVSTGGITATIADPRLIFAAALKSNATNIILCHNHPSGNLQPSGPDKDLTARIKSAGSFLEIKMLDHIIITGEGYLSFADRGIL